MSWNLVVVTGLVSSALSLLLFRGARAASLPSLRRRLRAALWLVKGYGALLLAGVLVPLARFLWLGADGDPTARAVQLGAAIAGVLNLTLGFVAFGMAPSVVAVMLSKRLRAREEEAESAPLPGGDPSPASEGSG